MGYDTKKQRAAYMRNYRKKKRLEKKEREHEATLTECPQFPKHPGTRLKQWSQTTLIVPPGHPLAGKPMILPDYGIDYIDAALTHRESLMCIGRKNAKSAIIAAYLLARLVGVLAIPGYRGGVCSVNKDKAAELWTQCKDIADASGLAGVEFTIAPRKIKGTFGGTVDFLSADKSAGHASGFDDAIIDELGLLSERDRSLVNGMRSSTSARNGRFMALSIMGDAPFTREMIARKNERTTAIHLYKSDDGCAIDDPDQWHLSNPGIAAGIKSFDYMRDEAQRCLHSPTDERDFRAFDLNLPGDPGRELICSILDWQQCVQWGYPEREGTCVLGIDLGGSNSMTAAVAVWLATGRMETWAAFGGVPSVMERGKNDGVGDLYALMEKAGELTIYADYRITPLQHFLKKVLNDLEGETIQAVGCDRYRKAEMLQVLDDLEIYLPMVWRGTGAHSAADGSHDVRAFQKMVRSGTLRSQESLAWTHAITESDIRYDGGGNPALDKRKSNSRIDVLQAGVIAAGLSRLAGDGKQQELTLTLVA